MYKEKKVSKGRDLSYLLVFHLIDHQKVIQRVSATSIMRKYKLD